MLSLISQFTHWTLNLPEPFSALVTGVLLLVVNHGLRRLSVATPLLRQPKLARRRVRSATGLTAQRGHS